MPDVWETRSLQKSVWFVYNSQIRHLHSAASTSTETTSNWLADQRAAQWWLMVQLTCKTFKFFEYIQPKQKRPFINSTIPKMFLRSTWYSFWTHLLLYDVSYTCQPLINSHWRVCGLVTAKQSHLCTLTGVAVLLLQPNYFTVREPQVVLWDRDVLVIHNLMMTLLCCQSLPCKFHTACYTPCLLQRSDHSRSMSSLSFCISVCCDNTTKK